MVDKSKNSLPDEKILTRHPSDKTGRNISKKTYDLFAKTIQDILRGKELTHNELFEQLDKKLHGEFTGNIGWYGETMKLDLEARSIIERTASKPQKYRLKQAFKAG